MSNKIRVDTSKIDDYISRLNTIIQSANTLDGNLIWHARSHGYDNIEWSLNNVGSPADFIWRLKTDIEYLKEVKSRADYVEQLLSQIDPLNYAESVAAMQQKFEFKQTIAKIASKFGVVGGAIGFVSSLYQAVHDGDFGDIIGVVSSGLGFASKFVKLMGDLVKVDKLTGVASFISDGELVQKIFGFSPAEFVGDTVGKVMGNDFIDSLKGDLFDATKGFACIAEWAGKGLDFVTKGFDNLKEFGEVSARMIGETISEFAVDIVLDAGFHAIAAGIATGIATGVAAVVGAPVAVPAVLVSIGALGLKAGADWVCEQVTGKDLTEFVSDTVLDCIGIEDDSEKPKEPTGEYHSSQTDSVLYTGANGMATGGSW